MLKTAKPRKGGVGIGGDSRAGCGESEIDRSGMDDVDIDDKEVEVDKVGKKGQKISKSKNLFKFKKTIGSDFLTPGAKLAFTKLRQAFLKGPILYHFDLERHIQIETNELGFVIGRVLSQLTLDNSSQYYLVAFFSRKMILVETNCKTHDGKFLAIIEAFKTWRYYLESSQNELLVFTNHNNLQQFMDTKSLSPKQVRWDQKLSCYHFQINYCQGKANGATNTLSQYL